MKSPFGNMSNILKQAQAMQEQMAKVQEQAATKTVSGTAGGGIVTVTVNGAMDLLSVKIDPEVVKAGDVEMLQDLVVAAGNDALKKSREMMAEEMKAVTGGMKIPGCSDGGGSGVLPGCDDAL
jgi:DNA-binding YbaB/EbfC family protein